RTRYREAFGLGTYDAGVLVSDPDASRLFEGALDADPTLDPKTVSNWVAGEYLRIRNASTDDAGPFSDPVQLGVLIRLVADGAISRSNAKEVYEAHLKTGEGIESIVEAKGLRQISDSDTLGAVVDAVIAANPSAADDVRSGKAQAIGFLVGQVMKETRGQANAAVVQAALRDRLSTTEHG
ncbi:MAG: Asp-tRNA(Asn)/Glu-tRNA(Gln) amidotransferase GatCAB subunit B, partial [Chloroflexota bacterium]